MAQDANSAKSDIGLYGLAVMGQNFALNIADHGFSISVCNRSYEKTETTVQRAKDEKVKGNLRGFKELKDFVDSLQKPRSIIILVKAGKPVTAVINSLIPLLENDDLIIDGGNEWYVNTEMRARAVSGIEYKDDEMNTSGIVNKNGTKINYMGMGISGGEEGARFGPSLMPGGPPDCYARVEKILQACAARAKDGTVCVTYIGQGGAGNYVKMVHNGIEYGDMQLIAEAYDLLKLAGGLTNEELAKVFEDWNKSELDSFLIEITAQIFKKKDDRGNDNNLHLVDKVLDQTGQKGTGKWTVKEAAEQGIAAPTISAALNTRYLSSLKSERIEASKLFSGPNNNNANDDLRNNKDELNRFINDVKAALYASKIMSYTQGMNLIRKVGDDNNWNLNLGKIASIWKGGCIIRAQFLDRITAAYDKNPKLVSLLFDDNFGKEVKDREASWRRVVGRAVTQGIAVPAMSGSLAYYDTYRRERLPANLTQSQRDFFGAHTYQRTDDVCGKDFVHSEWSKL